MTCPRCGSADTRPYTFRPPRKHPGNRIECDADCTRTGLLCRNCRTLTPDRGDLTMTTKAAKDIKVGDWCDFGSLAWQAGEPVTNDAGKILIQWGNGSVSEFDPDERVKIFVAGK